jgi:nucleoside-diphosphate-sugar epimerase
MDWQGRRVLVSGAAGFIGRLLCRELAERGAAVTALLRGDANGPWSSTLLADLGAASIAARELEGVDTIFHLAGKAHTRARTEAEIREYETVHVHGTRALMTAARAAGVRCCVLLSSVKAMGEGGADVLDEGAPCDPRTPYGVTKLAAERIVLEELPVPCPVVLRPTLVYGAGSKGNLDLMIRAARKGLFPAIDFPPNARSMIHVRDVVRACLLAATRPEACGRVFILADGRDYATRDILGWIFEALGRRPRPRVPFGLLKAAARLGDAARLCGLPAPLDSDALGKLAGSARYSSARIRRELGFAPTSDLRDGIREMVAAISGGA